MVKSLAVAALAVAACCTAYPQGAEPPLAFEVASVKAAAPPDVGPGGRMMIFGGCRGGPGSSDPGRVTCTNTPLKSLLVQAYDVKPYQVVCPPWLEQERYDVTAKIPSGATKEQYRAMLQNLLAERFKMTLHRETKDLAVYNLVLGKNGPKLKESVIDPNAPPPGSAAMPPPPPPLPPPGAMTARVTGPPPGSGRRMRIMMSEGRMRLNAAEQTMPDLADLLTNQLGRPVYDKTGLTGKYDIDLDFAPEPGQGMMRMMPLMPPGGGGPGGSPGPGPASADSEGGPTLLTAVQQQLGLKLEPGKGAVQLVVVDKAEKVPVEN